MSYREWLERQAEVSTRLAEKGVEELRQSHRAQAAALQRALAKFDSSPTAIAREIIAGDPNLGADLSTLVERRVDHVDKVEDAFDDAIDSFAGKVLLQFLARRNAYSSSFGAPGLTAETECLRAAILAVLTP